MSNAIAKNETVRELARDRWIGHTAACRISENVPLREIDETELIALSDWISFELIDRSTNDGHAEIRW